MKRYQRRKLNKVSKEIIKGMAVGGFIVAAIALPNVAQVVTMFGADTKKEKIQIKRSIQSLRKYGLVEVSPGKSLMEQKIRLSRAGKELLEYEDLALPEPKKWDGKWRVIAFDIPQDFFKARRALSLKLRELGCYHYQNSVFVYP